MKALCLIFFLLSVASLTYGQNEDVKSIKLPSGVSVKKGDTLTLGRGTRPDGDYVHIYTRSSEPLDKGFRTWKIVVKDIQTIGSKKRGETQFATINPTGLIRYFVDILQGVEAGEITKINQVDVSPVKTTASSSTAYELIKLKGLLDAGAITQAEYDSQKKKLLDN